MQDDAIVAIDCLRLAALAFKSRIFRCVLGRSVALFSQSFEVFLGLDAHHEMRTALQIEPEMNFISEILLDSGPGKVFRLRTTTWTDDEVNPYDCNDGDDDRTREQVLFLHCRNVGVMTLKLY